MKKKFAVYLERLKSETAIIQEEFSPLDLELGDETLCFCPEISVKGSAYLAEDHVIVQVDISAKAKLPCSVCNADVSIPIQLKNTYFTKEISELPSGIFHYFDDLREAILLASPSFIECNSGNCPDRQILKAYMKEKKELQQEPEEVYFPFKDLEKI